MPPQPFSRHFFTSGVKDVNDNLLLTERVPYRFQDFTDNRFYIVKAGDTLHTLAARLFDGVVGNPAGLYWVICDFQPEPILDPTLKLTPGRMLVIPSIRVLTEEIFSESRREA